MRPSTINGIRTIGVPVSDQDAALAFYTGTLRFETRLDAPISPTLRWIEVAPAGAAVSLALAPGAGGKSETGIRFTAPDAAAEHAALALRGVVVGDLLRWDGVPPMFTFDDPDGNRFVVVEQVR
jgi:catechol 2,3-dioxygenase-like lactoylglutathione lyase family enzyme